MPYDPNQVMGLDALSPTVAAYKQFVERQNNVGDPNVVQFLASRGEPQLAGLIAKKLRVENAAKSQQALAQQPPAAPPTVADQYNMAAQQQAQQEMMAQMAQMQQAQMAQAAPGLAGMPNPAMQQANFAGGGIVAFADGGSTGFGGLRMAEQGMINEGLTPQEDDELSVLEKQQFAISHPGIGANIDTSSFDPTRLRTLQSKKADYVQRRRAVVENVQRNLPGQFGANVASAMPTPTAQAAPAPATQAIPSGIPTLAELKNKYAPPVAAAKPPAPAGGIRTLVKPAAPVVTAPAAPTSTQADTISELERLIGKEPTKPESTPVVSKALDNERAWIKQHQDDYDSSKKEAQKAFFINLGASLLANRSPHFTTALGEALSQSYGTLSQDLRNLKKENDALALQELKVQQAREELQAKQDRESQVDYNKELADWKDRKLSYYKVQKEIEQDVLNRASREKETAATLKSHEKVANITAGYREGAAGTAALRARAAVLGEEAKIHKAVLVNPQATAKERADAQRQLNDISEQLRAMGYSGTEGSVGLGAPGWSITPVAR